MIKKRVTKRLISILRATPTILAGLAVVIGFGGGSSVAAQESRQEAQKLPSAKAVMEKNLEKWYSLWGIPF